MKINWDSVSRWFTRDLLRWVLVACSAFAAATGNEARADAVGSRSWTPMPMNFGFTYETGDGQKIDTAAGIVTKDLVSERDTTIPLRLSPVELARIHSVMVEQGLFDVTEPHPPYDIPNCSQDPHTDFIFEVTAGDVTRRFAWDNEHCANFRSGEWGRLLRILEIVQNIVESRPEYRRLPTPKSYYL